MDFFFQIIKNSCTQFLQCAFYTCAQSRPLNKNKKKFCAEIQCEQNHLSLGANRS